MSLLNYRFADAESSFSIRIIKDKRRKVGWRILPIFSIELHERDVLLLKRLQTFFGIGNIYKHMPNKLVYCVQSFDELSKVIIPHFDKYPLLTQKRSDFLLFKLVINLLNNKVQASIEGLHKIISIIASMNKGLSKELKVAFPNIIRSTRSVVDFDKIGHPNWLVGFVDGEGCFYVKPNKLSFDVVMSISQHSRDELLLSKIISYLGCGIIEKPITRSNQTTFVVYKFNDIYEKIIPFFFNYPLQSVKYLDFKDFCEVADLIKVKSHLTLEGIKIIREIKFGMNKGRKHK